MLRPGLALCQAPGGLSGEKGERSWVHRAQGWSLGSLGVPGGAWGAWWYLGEPEEPGGGGFWGTWRSLGEPGEPEGVENLEEPDVLGRLGSHSITSTPTGCLMLGKST